MSAAIRWTRYGREFIGRTLAGPWYRVAPSPAGGWLVQRGPAGALDAEHFVTIATAQTQGAAKARAVEP